MFARQTAAKHAPVFTGTSSIFTSLVFRAVFWVVLPCKLIVDRRFPDDGGSTYL
jgi:hypothetical protein